jgi:hypothetical protein
MTSWDDPLVIVSLAAVVVAALAIVYQVRKDRLRVELERFEERISPPLSPTETAWSIKVRPSKMVEHCNVIVGAMKIPIAKGGPTPLETKISVGGAENFRIPVTINPSVDGDGQMVTVKDDNRTVKKQRFRKIPLGK